MLEKNRTTYMALLSFLHLVTCVHRLLLIDLRNWQYVQQLEYLGFLNSQTLFWWSYLNSSGNRTVVTILSPSSDLQNKRKILITPCVDIYLFSSNWQRPLWKSKNINSISMCSFRLFMPFFWRLLYFFSRSFPFLFLFLKKNC